MFQVQRIEFWAKTCNFERKHTVLRDSTTNGTYYDIKDEFKVNPKINRARDWKEQNLRNESIGNLYGKKAKIFKIKRSLAHFLQISESPNKRKKYIYTRPKGIKEAHGELRKK